MEQKPNTIEPITTQSFRNENLRKYIDAIEHDNILYANRLVEVCGIHACEALIYTHQHNNNHAFELLLSSVTNDITKVLTYFIQTDHHELASKIIRRPELEGKINYLAWDIPLSLKPALKIESLLPSLPEISLLDLIIEKQNYSLIFACSIYAPDMIVRCLCRKLGKLLCLQDTAQ
jgi:hypothetical protein